MKKIFSNLIFQGLFQIIKLMMPVLTIPIVSHALQPNNIGLYNYSNSLVQYFVLFAGLGLPLYAQREIARSRDNKLLMSQKFWQLEILSLIVSIPIVMAFIIFAFNSSMKSILLPQTLTILAVSLDISWFFMGIEEFKKTSLRSITVSILTFILIYFFVEDPDDLYVYVAIQSFGIFFSQVIMWPFVFKKVVFSKVNFKEVVPHMRNIIRYFIPQVAVLLYTNMNKTFLGMFSTNENVAYYSNAILIINIVITLILTVDTVLFPKITNLIAKGKSNSINNIITQIFNFQLFFTIPAFFGIVLITPKLIPWFFGNSFRFIAAIMPYLALQIIINPIGNTLSRSYLLPEGRVKEYSLSVIKGAIVGVVINMILTPIMGIWGTVISATLSQLLVTVTRYKRYKQETFNSLPKELFFKYIFVGFIMLIAVNIMTDPLPSSLLTTLVQILLGAIFYFIATSVMKINPFIRMINLRRKIM